ncbi:PAS domain S-box protein [Candidatus Kaiserbacteria bacterium]|nr:PAS domain S-box protein [Candidatus Kaiserbacteria bacterium]
MTSRTSEVDYRSLFDNMLEGLAYCQMIFDREKQPIDFVFIEVNKNYQTLTGMKEVVGKKVTELIPDIRESNPDMFAAYARVSLTGHPEILEIYVKQLKRWFLISAYSPKKNFFVAVFQDSTDRKRVEKELENAKIAARNVLEDLEVERSVLAEAKAKDEAMLASIGDGVIVVDPVGNITFMNRTAQDLLGWKDTECVGKSLFEIVPMENETGDAVEMRARPLAVASASAGAPVKGGRVSVASPGRSAAPRYYIRKDKTRFPVAVTVAPVVLKRRLLGAIEVFRDITKEREVDRAKSEFVSLASHQLRTPLTTVNWYSEMLLKDAVGNDSEKRKEYLEKIHAGSERMVTLVNTLLDVSRIELGTLMVDWKHVSLVELLEDVVGEQRPQFEERKITVTTTFPKDIPAIETDSNLLRTVFQNLLSNAIKYTAPGGHVDVSVSVDADDGTAVVFSDTGYGIPKKDHDKIFTKMFRADNIKTKGAEGTGLGLYIVKSVLAALGGTIRFESEENAGTTFSVRLPPAKAVRETPKPTEQLSR